jgi:hypothetical protein
MGKAAMLVGVGAGIAAVRRWMSSGQEESRWLAVTVNHAPNEVMPEGRLPEPLDRLSDRIEVRVQPAPNAKGTEILARPREPVPTGVKEIADRVAGDDLRQEVRVALRQAKSLLETGEILRPTEPGSVHPTFPGKLLDLVTSRARGEGRL